MNRKIIRLLVDVILYGFLILISLYMLLPFVWMISSSLKPENEIFSIPPILISKNMTLSAYKTVIVDGNILRILLNTFIVATGATVARLFFCSLGVFGFAKYKFIGKGPLFGILVATLVVPFSVTLNSFIRDHGKIKMDQYLPPVNYSWGCKCIRDIFYAPVHIHDQ